MKWRNLFFLLFTLTNFSLKAEYHLQFCAKDSNGTCVGESDIFYWNGDKLTVTLLVSNKEGLAVPKLEFKIFEMDNDRTGDIYADLFLYTRAAWKSAYKKVYFVKPGYYKVGVYDEKNNRLTYGFLTVSDRVR